MQPLPVFSPVDEIRAAVAGVLADYNWVHNPQAKNLTLCAPYFGPGWYGRASCQYMLAHRIIKWSHIELAFEATTHLPAKYLGERLLVLERIWQECTDRDTAKRGTLTLLGLWAKPRQYKYRLCCTTDTADVLWAGKHAKRPTPGSVNV